MRRVTADYEMEIAIKIEKMRNDNKLTLALEGRLDTTTAPQLEAEIRGGLDGVTELVLACGKLEYLSSAGLRVILAAQKIMNKQGKMIVRQVNETILEVFEITGFIDILNIE
jgi:anti-sigma B factor antagonist